MDGSLKKKTKKEQASKKVEVDKNQKTRSQRMENRSVRDKALHSQDLKLKEDLSYSQPYLMN